MMILLFIHVIELYIHHLQVCITFANRSYLHKLVQCLHCKNDHVTITAIVNLTVR